MSDQRTLPHPKRTIPIRNAPIAAIIVSEFTVSPPKKGPRTSNHPLVVVANSPSIAANPPKSFRMYSSQKGVQKRLVAVVRRPSSVFVAKRPKRPRSCQPSVELRASSSQFGSSTLVSFTSETFIENAM